MSTLKGLADSLGLQFTGDPDYAIRGLRDIEILSEESALEEHYVYFIESKAVLNRHPKAAERGAVLTIPELAEPFTNAILVEKSGARLALIAFLKAFDRTPVFKPGISPKAIVADSARIAPSAVVHAGAVVMADAVVGERCIVYPGVVLEPFAEIGDDTVLFPNAVIGHHCVIGKHCIIHGSTVIGADGFGFYDNPQGRHKIPQIGNVVISDHVEVGASCTIDRAAIESTTIGAYTKIDDQAHIGHNCRVGRSTYIVGNTAVGGSVVIEDGAILSGMVIVKDHLKIAKGSIVLGLSGVAQDTEPGVVYFGTPARPAKQTHRMNAALERLPEMLKKFRELEEKLQAQEAARP
ncbi:MAG: hypothetical protein AUJ52_10165 [Elusimicrobia bacterium CG1_02_63_36]|nr:MAG: hypothetical protein AUJ52_10165 [Elusimicrobia bacterium CG1_02_63_36]